MEDANREPCLAYLEALLEKELAADAGSSSVERLRCGRRRRRRCRCRRRRWLRFWTATSDASHAAFMPLDLRSIALGVVELALTPRDQSKAAWPADLPATVEALAAAFDAFVAGLASSPALVGAAAAAAKVKVVADAVWSKLQKGYSKDLQHAQVGRRCTCRCGMLGGRLVFSSRKPRYHKRLKLRPYSGHVKSRFVTAPLCSTCSTLPPR